MTKGLLVLTLTFLGGHALCDGIPEKDRGQCINPVNHSIRKPIRNYYSLFPNCEPSINGKSKVIDELKCYVEERLGAYCDELGNSNGWANGKMPLRGSSIITGDRSQEKRIKEFPCFAKIIETPYSKFIIFTDVCKFIEKASRQMCPPELSTDIFDDEFKICVPKEAISAPPSEPKGVR